MRQICKLRLSGALVFAAIHAVEPASYARPGTATGRTEGRCAVNGTGDLRECDVFLSRPGTAPVRTTRANTAGRYRFDAVPQGEYV